MPLSVSWRPARASALALAPAVLALASCGSPAAPSPADLGRALPRETTTAHYVFHYSDGDAVEADRQERYHDWAVARLGVSPGRPIAYYKYRDRAQMQQITGKITNGWADPPAFAVHSIWPWDNHEVVHVLSALIGRPTDFFNEGLAVSMQVDPQTEQWEARWSNRSLRDWAAMYRANGQLPSLADVVETDAFRRVDDSKGYPIAGSFVGFMVDDRGIESMKSFFRTGARDARLADIQRQFSEAFGVTLQEAETRWHNYLDAR